MASRKLFVFLLPVLLCTFSSVFVLSQDDVPLGAASLAFVFDITGSMYDDLLQVIEGAGRILETANSRRFQPLYNFVLVPFHDPEIGPVIVTTDAEEFQDELRDLYVQGGGDCPEMSVGAIKKALEVSLPNSFVYVFTDARSKDYYLTEDVLTLVQQKQSQVVFVLTGDCGNHTHKGFQAYKDIASTSSGQVFLLEKSKVNEVLEFVRQAVNARKVNLMSVDQDTGRTQIFDIPIDTKLQEVTFSVSGTQPRITLINPKGKRLEERNLNVFLNITNALIYNVKDPIPGGWQLEISSRGPHTIRVTGLSTVDFQAGFSKNPSRNLNDTDLRPIQGQPTNLLLNTTDMVKPAVFTKLELLDLKGTPLAQFPVYRDPLNLDLYNVSTSFIPPDDFFYIKVDGIDSEGYTLRRTTPTAISPRIPTKPNVFMPSVTRGFYDQTAVITCHVDSLVPFSVKWYREGIKMGPDQYFSDSANATLLIPRAGEFSEGDYMCNASSLAGFTNVSTYLDISDPPPVILPPQNVSVLPRQSAYLTCEAFSTVPFNMTWTKTGRRFLTYDDRIKVLPNGTLEITNVGKQDEGQYNCTARNEGGSTSARIFIKLQVAPLVRTIPREQNFVVGQTINVTCVAEGYPKPTFTWMRRNQLVIPNDRYIVKKGFLLIKNIEREDQGDFECLARNSAGHDTAIARLSYIEAPRIQQYKKRLLVAKGDKATLFCDADGIPPPNVTWYRGDRMVQTAYDSVVTRDGKLVMNNVQRLDSGEYKCVASNEAGMDNATVLLEIGSPPTIVATSRTVGIEIQKNGVLPCRAKGSPPPKIIWQRGDGKPFNKSSRLRQLPNGGLQINNIRLGDEGIYTCLAQNHFGVADKSTFVSVTGIVRPLIAYSYPFIKVLEGDSAMLDCTILLGKPKPKVAWTKNGRNLRQSAKIKLKGNGKMEIMNVTRADDGEYICVASNIGGNATYHVTVDVIGPPKLLQELEKDKRNKFTVIQGRGIVIPCNVEADPRPSFTWFKDGSPISLTDIHYYMRDDGSLEIFSADPQDTAQYKCVASNKAGEVEKNVRLFVQVGPSIDGKTEERYEVLEGKPVFLPCEAEGKPRPVISWRRNFTPFRPRSTRYSIKKGGIRISKTKVRDKGIYECIASNTAGNTTKVITLVVYIRPSIESGETSVTVMEGDPILFECETFGDPKPSVVWTKNDTIMDISSENSRYLVYGSGSLAIDAATLRDAGKYTCLATNPAGSASIDFSLTVHAPPSLPLDIPGSTQIIENNPVILPCPATGTPPPRIVWLKNEVLVTGDELGINILSDGSLEIKSADGEDTGQYRCMAINVAGNATRVVDLKILIPPKLLGPDGIDEPEKVKVVVNDTITLRCPVADDVDPRPSVLWYKNERPLVLNNEDSRIEILKDGMELSLSQTLVDDTARYKCVATNIAGAIEKDFDLEVQVPPVIDDPTASPDDMSVVIGQPLYINCPVSGIPPPQVTWYKDGMVVSPELDPNLRIQANGRRLEIVSAQVRDRGRYECVGENIAGKTDKAYTVDVHVPPRVENPGTIDKTEVMTNQTIKLTCPATGIPLPDITWFVDNQPIKSNTSKYTLLNAGWLLTIANADVSDSNRYICRAENIAGENEKVFDVEVLVPPKINRETSDPNPNVVVNTTAVINCPVTGIPVPEILWYRNGVLLDSTVTPRFEILGQGRQLRIHSSQVQDRGRYTCLSRNRAGEDSVDFSLNVFVPPSIDSQGINRKPKVVANNSITIDCPASGVPPPKITWYKNSQVINIIGSRHLSVVNQGTQLVIQSANIEDAGRYACVASNEAGEKEENFDLEVQVPPSIPDFGIVTDPKVVENDSVVLDCPALGLPIPEVIWLQNGQPLDFEENPHISIVENGRRLVFDGTEVSDTGTYTCIASNEAGTQEKKYNLEVRVPPSIDADSVDDKPRVIKGHTATIHCPVTGIPFPDIMWLKDGQPIEESIRYNIINRGVQLRIQDSTETDSAQYSCIATNPAGSDRAEFDLVVLVPPVIDESNVVYNPKVIQDRHVILECPVSGNPRPTVLWLLNGEPVIETDRIRVVKNNLLLEINRAQVADTARYSCIATNEAGELRRNFQLEVLVPPTIDRTKISDNTSVIQNKTLYLDCPVSGVPQPSIIWLRNTVPLLDFPYKNLRLMDNDRRLEISSAQPEDAGIYTCKASNAAGRDKVETNVLVHVPPVIAGAIGVTDIVVKENKAVNLYCNITGVPLPNIIWLKDNEIIVDSPESNLRILSDGQLLKVLDASTEDTGRYICQAKNDAGVAEKLYQLETLVPPKINGSGELQVVPVIMDQSVRLECPAVGIPPPVIRWYRQGKQIPLYGLPNIRIVENGHALIVVSAQLLDFGDYSCRVQNDAGVDNLEFLLSILVPPEIRSGPRQVAAIIDAKAVLECETSGQPRPEITWEKDGKPFPSTGLRHRMLASGSLEFVGVRIKDTGEYTCTASNDAGNKTRNIQLSVSVPAMIKETGPSVVKSPIGEEVMLSCEVEGSPKPKILWLRNRGIINSDASAGYTVMENGSLYIERVELYDTGVYTCIAQNVAGNDNREITLEVQVPPKIDSFQKQFTVLQNRTVVIPCSADGVPSPKIIWKKNGEDITPTNYDLSYSRVHFITLQTGGLAIPHTRAEDAGMYTCIAVNDAGNDTIELELIVQVPPQIDSASRQYQTTVGDRIELPCDVEGNPKPWIDWSRDGRRIDTREARFSILDNGSLVISDIQEDDTGRYVCSASNVAGRDSQSRLLRVQVPPRIIRSPQDTQVTMNSQLELQCAAVGVPTPSITWMLNDRLVPYANSVNGRSNYFVRNVMKEDAGEYTCVATNPANGEQVMEKARVIVTVPPRVTPHGDKSVSVRERVMLSCSVIGDNTNIIWTKNGRQITLNNRIQQLSNGSLIIYDSTASDAGEYKCIASNDAGTSEGVAMLTVRQPPTFKIEPSNITAKLGDTVIFDCSAEGEPKPAMYWWKNTVELESEGRITILPNNSLRIVAIQLKDSEMYRCFASNNIGKTAVEAHLIVVVDGMWSPWGEWESCSITCGVGLRYRSRTCSNPLPANGGKVCHGETRESSSCAAQACPVDGSWGNWGSWDQCSTTCGSGTKQRIRLCNNPTPQLGGQPCPGNSTQITSCEETICPINGGWGEWGLWNPCSRSCGEGYRSRDRKCNSPRPQFGGLKCIGSATETEICLTQRCAVDGDWNDWTSWSSCTLSCGGGSRARSRECNNPPPQLGGAFCVGSDSQKDYCNTEPCPVHGNWSPWDEWGECSNSCGGGQRKRFRYCTNPPPGIGGRLCPGQAEETSNCNPDPCPVNGRWGAWSDWSECSKSCDGGTRQRRRECTQPQYGGRGCLGNIEQVDECNKEPCYKFPIIASGNLIGNINNIDIEAGTIVSEMLPTETGTRVKATVLNIPSDVVRHLQHLTSILSPIYWTTAKEVGGAYNGFTLTKGEFQREVQVEFATGEILKMNHYVNGMNKQGELQYEVVVQGRVPDLGEMKNVVIKPYSEDYIQTGPGTIYASSSRLFQVDDHIMPYAWNHTITYNDKQGVMPFLVERLQTSDVEVNLDDNGAVVNYQLHANIAPGSPSNTCPSGFDLDPEGPYCKDDDECLRSQPCGHFCHNSPGSYACSCPSGYVLKADGSTCSDVDECSTNGDVCPLNQQCVNTPGSYSCVAICTPGFKRSEDRLSCKDVNECEENSRLCSHQCTNVIGSYQCSCKDGYRLSFRGRCFDINECRQAVNPCTHRCINTRGSYRCSCPRGYRQKTQTLCEDIDECKDGSHRCRADQQCENTDGRYICRNTCPSGYQRQQNGRCTDVDECLLRRHRCLPNQRCINTPGSYRCACPPGLESRGPGQACTDIDECETGKNLCQHNCTNTRGSYTCDCPPGYRTTKDGFGCTDINECLERQVNCGEENMCFNQRGSHTCISIPCPKDYVRDPTTDYCVLECVDPNIPCPPGSKYADIIQFKTLALPSGIKALQDLVRLTAYNQNDEHLRQTLFRILENDPKMEFRIRLENGKGVVYTLKALEDNEIYKIMVKAQSYDNRRRHIQYQTTFIIHISVSAYPY
ncbi:hypothetical protein SNE40_021325 [Patella caerulea]|uniref:Hemicentin-1 n=1 Tax=Patella caerulea TaxID=87958 RepID=A0AAN8FZ98_PATCE